MASYGSILFGHGSRDPLWPLPIEAVARRMRELQPGCAVQCAYLELMVPDLASAVDALVAQGCTHIAVWPMFLGMGRHARQDLPLLLQAQRQRHPGVQFDQQGAVGEQSAVIELLARLALPTPQA